MQKFILFILAFLLLGGGLAAQTNFFEVVQAKDLAAEQPKTVRKMGIYRLNEPAMRAYLLQAPLRFQNNGITLPLEIPLPDGTVETFGIVEAPLLAPEVAALNPEIRSYAGNGLTHKSATIRFTLTSAGFNAIILGLNGDNVYFEAYAKNLRDVYFNYFTSDAIAPDNHNKPACGVGLFDLPKELHPQNEDGTGGVNNNTGGTLRTFRLVMAAAVEFTAQNGGTQASGLAAAMVYVNNMTAVYERELCVTFTMVSGINMVFATEPDGYSDDESLMINENQTKADAVIGVGNYDIGHVLGFAGPGNSGGGVAYSPSVCTSFKAGGASRTSTGFAQVFYDQLVMHEVGHQFGMAHSYNSNIPVCTTRSQPNSVEPGSGTTIMSYGYTCGTDDYPTGQPFLNFHSNSYSQAVAIITGSCAATAATGNLPPVVTMPASVTIPISTPFALSGSATDADAGLTYSWEGMNIGAVAVPDATVLANTAQSPFFRSYEPSSAGATRTFPPLARILDGSNYDVGDKLPSVGVTTTHRLTVRDNRAGAGGLSFGTTTVTVDGGIGPFLVTSNLAASYAGLSAQTVTWSVNGTAAATPNVKISLSTDGGQTFPNVLAASTPNDGSEVIIMTNEATSIGRIKVEAVNNIFFDISNSNFTITAVLPVELTRFDATLKGENTALLTWQTATEIDNQGYDVEMANNSGAFRKVGFVKGKGTTNSATNYEFAVPNLSRELHYFRLKMKDLNGEFTYSPVRTLQLDNVKDVVSIYPNPAPNGLLQITLTRSDAEQVQAELINSVGQLISTTPFVNDGNIMRLQLPAAGVYNLVLRLDNGAVITKRVVML